MRTRAAHVLAAAAILLTACGDDGPTAIANPASQFCEPNDDASVITTAADGSQQGWCDLADGTRCDEWAFYRGDCGPEGDAQPTE